MANMRNEKVPKTKKCLIRELCHKKWVHAKCLPHNTHTFLNTRYEKPWPKRKKDLTHLLCSTHAVGTGPVSVSLGAPALASASFGLTTLQLGGSVRTLLASPSGGQIFVGGDFLLYGADQVNNIIAWDGTAAKKLGNGVDGAVYALIGYNNTLVVGGAFKTARKARGGGIPTGGLAMWRADHVSVGKQAMSGTWQQVGGAVVEGTVMAMVTQGQRLYVGGMLTRIGPHAVSGIAMLDENGSWKSLGTGIAGGPVNAMAMDAENLYVGGQFVTAGGVTAKGAVRWSGGRWHAMGEFKGAVHAIATVGEDVFFAGDFTAIDGVPIKRLARYHAGHWTPVQGAVDSCFFLCVYAVLTAINFPACACLYI
jgi:hypothetical protein